MIAWPGPSPAKSPSAHESRVDPFTPQESRNHWSDEALKRESHVREKRWTESIAVGSKQLIEVTLKRLEVKAKGRKIVGGKKSYEHREPAIPYGANFTPENGLLRFKNTYFWDDII